MSVETTPGCPNMYLFGVFNTKEGVSAGSDKSNVCLLVSCEGKVCVAWASGEFFSCALSFDMLVALVGLVGKEHNSELATPI